MGEFMKEILLNSICHWSSVMNFSEKIILKKLNLLSFYMKTIKN